MNIEQRLSKYFILAFLTKNTFYIHNISFEFKKWCMFLYEFENMMLQYFLAVFFEKLLIIDLKVPIMITKIPINSNEITAKLAMNSKMPS